MSGMYILVCPENGKSWNGHEKEAAWPKFCEDELKEVRFILDMLDDIEGAGQRDGFIFQATSLQGSVDDVLDPTVFCIDATHQARFYQNGGEPGVLDCL